MNISQLSKKTGASRKSCRTWLAEAGMKATDKNALKLIESRHAKKPEDNQIDPETGLTWYQLKLREEAKQKQRDNRIADLLENKTYMLVSDHLQILSILANHLEQVPHKARSELGLTESQFIRLRKMLDEGRENAAKEIVK